MMTEMRRKLHFYFLLIDAGRKKKKELNQFYTVVTSDSVAVKLREKMSIIKHETSVQPPALRRRRLLCLIEPF